MFEKILLATDNEGGDINSEASDFLGAMQHYIPKPVHGQPFYPKKQPGVYDLDEGYNKKSQSGTYAVESDDIYVIRDDTADLFRKEVREFWQMESWFAKNGLLHKRGIILNGAPGSGKTSLLKQEIPRLVKEQEQIVFLSHSPYALKASIEEVRASEKRRPITAIIEDIDEIANSYGLHTLLEMLDGANSSNHVLYIATTNNLEQIPEKLKRPGRFDRKIEVPYPTTEQRAVYLAKKMRGKPGVTEEVVRKIANSTEGLSFAHLRELMVSAFGYRQNLAEEIKRLRFEAQKEKSKSA